MLRFIILALIAAVPVAAADWPQYLGPERNGVYAGPELNEKWPAAGPRVVWRKQIGAGLAGPVVAQNRLILFHRADNREIVESFDAGTGAAQWRHAYPTSYRDDFGFDEGPRASRGRRWVTLGAEGPSARLHSGRPLWNADTAAVRRGGFGAAGSPRSKADG
jgi:hypothetical protein